MVASSGAGAVAARQGPSLTYFGAADRQTELFIDESQRDDALNASIVHGVLFDEGIAIPDVFHFISRSLFRHVMEHDGRKSRSLLEAAVAAGLARPIFRQLGETAFSSAWPHLHDQGLQGLLDRPEAQILGEKLDKARTSNFKPEYWPKTSVGAMYAERLKLVLRPDLCDREFIPPPAAKHAPDVWKLTADWRGDIFEELLEDAAVQGAGVARGLRRGDYMNAIGRTLGIQTNVDDMAELVRAAPDKESAFALRILCLWINETYHYNQAREFSFEAAWHRFDPTWSRVTLAALQGFKPGRPPPSVEEHVVEARLPTPQMLTHVDGDALLAVRNGLVGTDYFAALSAWRRAPGEAHAELQRVKMLFGMYADALHQAARPTRDDTSVQVRLGRLKSPEMKAVGVSAMAAVGLTDGILSTAASTLATAGGVGWAVYSWWRKRPTLQQHTLRKFPLALTLESEAPDSA